MASSLPSPQDCTPFADRRAYPRIEVALPAFLQANGQRLSVQIIDLSSGGAKLSCQAILPAGTAVILDFGTGGRAAVVRWQGGGHLGLCFDSQLDVREVSALNERSNALATLMKTRK